MSEYESIEPQFDLAAQEARAASRKPKAERPLEPGVGDTSEQAAIRAELAEKAALEPVPEVQGKVDQEPELPQDPAVAPPDPEVQGG